jgi:predicted aldo/keto reductase-like oxidoreductase
LVQDNIFDVFHLRYNAAHRGAETEVFDQLSNQGKPGIVSYTATRWGQLLNPKKVPPGEKPLSASDCYRFVLSNPNVDICMCGPRDRGQMKEALRSLELGPKMSWCG